MESICFKTMEGGSINIDKSLVCSALSGDIVFPDDDNYDQSRALWNGMIDKHPSVLVKVTNEKDVENAVAFAAHYKVLLAVKAGGHNIAGKALTTGGLVIDLALMNDVLVDQQAQTVKVGPGASLADVDSATQKYDLVVPTGINSTTGISGLTLGGGFGWTTAKFGLTIDNLCAARVVLASGETVIASKTDNPDLFWAIRGGGGNFGVVTEFTFTLYQAGPEVIAGMVVYPFSDLKSVVAQYQHALASKPDELSCWLVMRKAPPLPFLPEKWHGEKVLIMAMCYTGELAAGEIATLAFTSIGEPIANIVGPMPFVNWQMAFDPLLVDGARNYWKSHDIAEVSDAVIDTLSQAVEHLPSDECEIFLAHLAGAMTAIAPQDTPWINRSEHFIVNIHTRWQSADDDSKCIDWARTLHADLTPYSMGSVYVNFIPEGDDKSIADVYGANYPRLKHIKLRFDPKNLFRTNQNILPS